MSEQIMFSFPVKVKNLENAKQAIIKLGADIDENNNFKSKYVDGCFGLNDDGDVWLSIKRMPFWMSNDNLIERIEKFIKEHNL